MQNFAKHQFFALEENFASQKFTIATYQPMYPFLLTGRYKDVLYFHKTGRFLQKFTLHLMKIQYLESYVYDYISSYQ